MAPAQQRKILMPHQADAVDWARYHDAVGFFHEMRLGKTLSTIRWIEERARLADFPVKNVLIVCPLSVAFTWQDELAAEGHTATVLRGTQQNRVELAQHRPSGAGSIHWRVVNYEGLVDSTRRPRKGSGRRTRARPTPLVNAMEDGWDAVVLDESKLIKNPDSKVSKIVVGNLSSAPLRACLSGFPNPISELDFFQQYNFLEGGGGWMGCATWWAFRNRYFYEAFNHGWLPKKGAKQKIMTGTRTRGHFLTRADVGLANVKTEVLRQFELPPRNRRAYLEAETQMEIEEGAVASTKWGIVSRNWTSQLCGGRATMPELHKFDHPHKLDLLATVLSEEYAGEQALVWFRYVRELSAAAKFLRRKFGLRTRAIYGRTPPPLRHEYVRRFQDGKLDILCCQQSTLKYGADLSKANLAVYYSCSDDPDDYVQSRERIAHPKKKKSLAYVHLLARNTIDVDRYHTLEARTAAGLPYRLAMNRARISRRKQNQ